MKKLYLVFLVAQFLSSGLYAQKIKYMLQGGFTASYAGIIQGRDFLPEDGFLLGLTGGALTDIPVNKKASFQTGLLYVQKGAQDGSFMDIQRLNYLEVPANLIFYKHSNRNRFYMGIGLTTAFAVNGKIRYEQDGEMFSKKIQFGKDPDELNRVDAGVNLLAGYVFKSGWTLNLSGTFSLTSLSKEYEARNKCFAIKLGYFLKTKKKSQ